MIIAIIEMQKTGQSEMCVSGHTFTCATVTSRSHGGGAIYSMFEPPAQSPQQNPA
jgi:hypothetical protein